MVTLSNGLALHVTDHGHGRPILLLHGGAGPRSVAGLGDALASRGRALTATYPGFDGTPRPAWLDTPADLAIAYAELLDTLDLRDVVVIGNSLGGWVAAELALRAPARLSHLVLINAAGIAVDGHPIASLAGLAPPAIAKLAYADPARFALDPSKLSPAELATMAANREAMATYTAGTDMHDAKLRRRLRRVTVPALVLWGEADRVIDADYGRAYAAAFANGRFELIAGAGHFPQLEQPARTIALITYFAGL